MRRPRASGRLEAHEPQTRLGLVRAVTYFPGERRLLVVTANGKTFVADDVDKARVDAARPFGNRVKLVRLVEQVPAWRLVRSNRANPFSEPKPRVDRLRPRR